MLQLRRYESLGTMCCALHLKALQLSALGLGRSEPRRKSRGPDVRWGDRVRQVLGLGVVRLHRK